MSRNKLLMIASMMLTIVVVTDWLGDNRSSRPGPALKPEDLEGPGPELTNQAQANCPSPPEVTVPQPDASGDDLDGVEDCHEDAGH